MLKTCNYHLILRKEVRNNALKCHLSYEDIYMHSERSQIYVNGLSTHLKKIFVYHSTRVKV